MTHAARMLLGCAVAALLTACAGSTPHAVDPPGAPKSVTTRVLETDARALQTQAPLAPMDVYLVGFHAMKEDPAHQMEAHHFCRQVNADFMQCVLFDGNTATANLTGIEYIISERGQARPTRGGCPSRFMAVTSGILDTPPWHRPCTARLTHEHDA